MACNCIAEIKERLKDKLRKDDEYQGKDISLNINNLAWLFKGGQRMYSVVEISYPWVTKTGKDRVNKSSVNIVYSYCPFCGNKIEPAREA
ncbi:MAG: hypothetical protein RSA29_10380 [Clostridium sp.]|uniref:hypothetical protein n=1 Tax=Clostridium sp. TaxID=1506 RepID=UPI0030600955